MLALAIALGEPDISDVHAKLGVWFLLFAPRAQRQCLLNTLADGHRVIPDGHMTVAAGVWQEQIHHTFGLPVRHRRTEFGMQPSKFPGGRFEKVPSQWRYVPYRIRTPSIVFGNRRLCPRWS